MLKSCVYCGRVHGRNYICQERKQAERERAKKASGKEDRFRWSGDWKKKAKAIKERDSYLCQACVMELDGTVRQYNSESLSVHHIVALRDNYAMRLDDSNLITLCRMHHEMADRGEIQASTLAGIIKDKSQA